MMFNGATAAPNGTAVGSIEYAAFPIESLLFSHI